MNNIWWQTKGQGNVHLVLLHGWGLNAEVWRCIDEELSSHFTLHLVDLPGFGRSRGFGALSLADMAEAVLQQAPDKAIWLGWSLGGLVASQIVLTHPERVQALVTVASSPCFSARDEWPGIKPDVLAGFQQQLSDDFQRTVERFLALQTMGTETARQDARALKKTVLALPMPEVDVLNGGLEILKRSISVSRCKTCPCRFCDCMAISTVWCRAKWCRCWINFGLTANHISSPKRPMRRLFRIRSSFVTCWWR
ncbi:carboxylesterase (biotin synthesis protein BioH) [Escherichia coli]|uniref:Carboxylesterase (Biotin synthesis protein BioH) n=1 Tax=Escherichia coli TaxID=562 RepID=A0A376TRX3_ECOLX|nr:carboxylesterase (biotin synthesis protein BioH) [Escherichia coli]